MTKTLEHETVDKAELEEGVTLSPRFDANGLVTAVVTDSKDNEVLMLAHMNAQAITLTIETGVAHYWSRSRQSLWKKGETSGNVQIVDEIHVDCDQDALLLKVHVQGADATCHTGRRSCFYRKIINTDGHTKLQTISQPLFDPKKVYSS